MPIVNDCYDAFSVLENTNLDGLIMSKTLIIKKIGKINIHIYKNELEKNTNFVITKGVFNQKKSIPVRVLSNKIKSKNILNNNKIKKIVKIYVKI